MNSHAGKVFEVLPTTVKHAEYWPCRESGRCDLDMNLPRIIHQTWKDAFPHAALGHCLDTFVFLNPEWERRFYTDADCLAWLGDRAPLFLQAYQSCKTGIHRADFFRILVLYFEGGVYADLDFECLRPLDELLARLPAGKTVYLTRDHPIHERIHFGGRAMWMNDFMIAAPGDPLVGEILKWMLNSPPGSSSAANAVMETGPGVISSVIEMLGGPEMIPNLGIIPTPWVHPLPDMNCGFPEKPAYHHQIATRSWLEREVFAVHYWFHTWVTGADTNMLTDYADVLLSTRGEQVERLLQWELRDSTDGADFVMAAALAELAEMGGELEVWLGPDEDAMIERFLELLALSGLQPRFSYRCWETPAKPNPLRWRLEGMGGTQVDGNSRKNGKNVLLLLTGFNITPDIPEMDGLLLGPSVAHREVIASDGGITLTEMWREQRVVPQVVHLFPSDEAHSVEIAMHFAEKGWETRCWTTDQLRKVLQQETLGSLNPLMMTPRSLELAAGLVILREQGGAVFSGNSVEAVSALKPMHRPTLLQERSFWFFACEAHCPLLEGAFQHWTGARKRSRANAPADAPTKRELSEHLGPDANMRQFIELRLRAMHLTGRAGNLNARRTTSVFL